jgi:hypothetical protein
MALVKETLKAEIKAAFDAQSAKKENPVEALSDLADKLATAFDNYIKSATVSTTVNGTCATPAGAGTIAGSGTGGLS